MPDYIPDRYTTFPGRFFGTTREVLRGDLKLAGSLIGIARVLLGNLRHRMSLCNIPVGSRTVTMPDGSVIKVSCMAGINQIYIEAYSKKGEEETICIFYVESGLVHINIAGTETIYLQEPGLIYRDEDIDSIPDVKGDIRIEELPKSGTTSIAFGIKELLNDPIDLVVKLAQQNLVFIKALASGVIPASLYSGKLQLFVQTKYGMKPEEWDGRLTQEAYKVPYLSFPDENKSLRDIYFDFGHSCGIVSSPDLFIYFLVSIEDGQITYSRIDFNNCGAALLGYIKSKWEKDDLSLKDLLRFESYLFSKSIIRSEIKTLVIPAIYGKPIGGYNGWSFSIDGDKASIITHEEITTQGPRYFISRSYTLDFTIYIDTNSNKYELSAKLKKTNETEFQFRGGYDFVWYYDYRLNYMVPFGSNPALAWHAPFGNDVPMYCYYSQDGELITTRWRYIAETGVPKPAGTYDGSQQNLIMCGAEKLYDFSPPIGYSDSTYYERRVLWGNIVTAGFYSELVDASGSAATNDHYRKITLTSSILSDFAGIDRSTLGYGNLSTNIPTGLQCNHPRNDFSATPIRNGSWVVLSAQYVRYYIDESRLNNTINTCLILPKNDVSSVYMAKLANLNISSGQVVTSYRSQAYWKYFLESNGASSGLADYYDTNNTTVDIYITGSLPGNEYGLSCFMVDRADAVTIEDETYEDWSDIPSAWNLFFSLGDYLTVPRAKLQVIHNLRDDCMYSKDIASPSSGELIAAKGAYPYNPGVTFVGWT